MEKLGAIILSGGKSSRFGTDKGMFHFQNKPLVEYSLATAKKFTNEIVIMSSDIKYMEFGYPTFPDIYPDAGPMGGIHAGLANSKYDCNIVLACDTPFIDVSLVDLLINNYNNEDVLLYETADSRVHPLLGIYHRRLIKKLEDSLNKRKHKLIQFILSTNHKIIRLEEQEMIKKFSNFNDQAALLRNR